MSTKLPTVLENIVAQRRTHLPAIAERIAHVDRAQLPRSQRSLYDSLRARPQAFIMECKSSSPSLGVIRADYQPGELARVYSRYASGISVLCEPEHFGGDYDHLATVSMSTHLPVLCKDFIVDPVQLYAARYYGADAILLMLSVLGDDEYAQLSALADELGLDVLTEVIDEDEVARALRLGARIVGINNRNLHDRAMDLSRTSRLAKLLPVGTLAISESGIRNNRAMRALGAHASGFLVGSQLSSQPDTDWAARALVYGHNKVCGLTTPSTAQAARAAGAVYGGLIFEEASPRNVSRETSKKIIADEPGLRYVAVSRRTTGWAELVQPGIHALQIHSPYQGSLAGEKELLAGVRAELRDAGIDPTEHGVEIWRAISMTTPEVEPGTLSEILVPGTANKLVLDAGQGGTGTSFDWRSIPDEIKPHALLAGGINPENIRGALELGCFGIDLNSGVEVAPSSATETETAGAAAAPRKDAALIRSIFHTIRDYTEPRERTRPKG